MGMIRKINLMGVSL
jgi:FtsZ-binding cell division protein ZapB